MKRTLKLLLLAAIGWLGLVAHPAFAQGVQGMHGQLVSAGWLKDRLGARNLVLLDASPTKFYLAGHIPGAVSVSFTKEESSSQNVNLSYGGGIDLIGDTETAPFAFQDRPVAEMQELFRSWGVTRDSHVVLYDTGGAMHATRLFFSFVYHGFPLKNLHILDGGMAKWTSLQYPVSQEVHAPARRGDFRITGVKSDIKTSVPEVLAASGDPVNNALVEGLTPDWHFGEALNYDRRGHIPHAIMAPAADFYNADKTFKSPQDIRKMLAHLGIKPEQAIFTHCGGGIAGSVPFFAIKYLAGYPKVKHFTESQLGWLHDQRSLPFWTYDAPYLLRDAAWLQWWGGQRTRSLGSIHVSIVDVRAEPAFREQHVPFALNVPADVFRKELRNPVALRQALGTAGVNPSHEAVVVSGAGISKDAALAFVALEALGQKKVSILSDGLDKWAAQGFPLRDTPTVVAPRKVRFDLAVPPVDYKSKDRAGVLIADAAATSGVYPKLYIASGKELPANVPAGKVVHVPYTELLQADGTPKPAATIWAILHKAGVTRYAELVTVSDDVGEAAANHVVLKLMGFPDVKTLVL